MLLFDFTKIVREDLKKENIFGKNIKFSYICKT